MDPLFLPNRATSRPLRGCLKTAIAPALAWWAGSAAPLGQNLFGIITYHRVWTADRRFGRPTYNVSPRRLHEQLSGLLQRGYAAWPLGRVLDHCRRGIPVPRRTFVVTFDDGYANNLTEALPVLQSLAIPATIFLATGYLDSDEPFPFDSWTSKGDGRCRDAWAPLRADQCRTAVASGLIELGCHTHTHQVFGDRPASFEEDLHKSLACLHREFGIDQPAFSFPFGIADGPLRDAARRSGVTCGLTTTPQLVPVASDPFSWGRFGVSESDSAASLSVKLNGWFDAARRVFTDGVGSLSFGKPATMVRMSRTEVQP
ncbi:MAG: polysaccharide deacetylase family protein [Planctomycetaceae bacterium]|nr:polysaccharide deacetylase family protein [Planctomycetaceae bacterium]